MNVPSLSPQVERELAVLRRRAYGPDADISADPEAAGRLDRLERAARSMSTTAGRSAVFEAPSGEHQPVASTTGTEPVQPARLPGASATRWRRRAIWLATATIAASAAVAMAIAAVAAGPRPDVSLAMSDETPIDALTGNILWLVSNYDIEQNSTMGHDRFAAITVWTARTETGMRCVFLTVQDAYELAASCMPPGLDPTIDFVLYPGRGDIVGGDFPDGTTLRFVGTGDAVDVWVRPPLTP